MKTPLVPLERIEKHIYLIRDQKVMLGQDLATLYDVVPKVLMQAVKRNAKRFPTDFMFQLTNQEFAVLKSQIVTSNKGRGGRRFRPYAFTEQGVAMLSSVLNSERAISVNIEIMRAFVKLRELIISNAELAKKIAQLEKRYDHKFKVVFDAIFKLMNPPKTRAIGFRPRR